MRARSLLLFLMIAGTALGQFDTKLALPTLGPKPPVNGQSSYAPLQVIAAPTVPTAVTPKEEITTHVTMGSNDVSTVIKKIPGAPAAAAAPVQPGSVWGKVSTPAFTLAPAASAPGAWQQSAPDKSAWDSKPATGSWK